uniref:Small nuclear RNA activating complex polypeptide 4 n=1 Tax=Pseudonaja textilis TaxID=8673 RepID=A0A670YSY7_PSETE
MTFKVPSNSVNLLISEESDVMARNWEKAEFLVDLDAFCDPSSQIQDFKCTANVDQDGEKQDGEEEEVNLPQTPETCLQMNLVYQEVIQEKIEEINSLLAQNKKQQEKLTWELAGTKGIKSSDGKSLPANMFLGHFMKPYFKDKTSGFGPPANDDAREKARQGIKSFEELITVKWKSREKLLLQQAVVSDLTLVYMLPEETLLGNRHDEHDWDKIANINFEGTRNANELRKYWQNYEHPNINKKEWSEEEIEKLKEIAVQHGGLHWEAIAQELGTQRTAFQCLQKFQSHNKDFKRSEWSPEEDQMLRQLVQEMRIGNHIPYRKMAYYMEGRDSAQLIYRWTKRVDPNLKRGAWTPKEDALLLKAVAKYGERDWYKIRAEVPGRNDLQCRDRYLHSLHYDIKKGKWSQEEEKKLIELTEKYGRGHWAKIASELPHRSGSQCLSKWKILLGYRKEGNRRHPRRRRVHRWSSSPSESSSEYSDLDLDAEEEEDERPKAHQPKGAGRWRVPSLDLWVPARKEPLEANPGGLPAVTLLSKGFDVNRKRRMDSGPLLGPEEDQRTDDLVDLVPETPELAQMKGNEVNKKKHTHGIGCKDPKFELLLFFFCPAQLGQPAASGQPNKKLIPLKAKEGPVPANTWKARSPPGLAPKPKTVSELLREKRLREQSARKGSQKRIFLAPQLLLSASVVVPQTRGPMAPLANCPNAPAASQVSPRPPPASASVPGRDSASPTDLAGASRERSLPCNGDKDEAAGGEGRDSNQESFSPQGDPAGPPAKVNPILAEALCPSPASGAFPPLLPTLVAAHAQPTAVAQPALPISWVLTPQGLLPVTLLTLPSQGKPLASGPPTNPSQPAETSVQIPTPTMGDPVVEGSPMPAGHPGCPQSDAGPRLADVPPPPPPPPPLLGNSTEVGCPPSPAGAGAPALPCTVFGGTAASAPNSEASPPPHPNQGPATQEVPSNPALEACPTPRPPQEGTASPLSRLLSLEAEPAVKAWAKENREGRAPVLGRGLPYLPPFLCSLKTLSALLLNKRSLEQSAASLLDPEGQREEPSQPDLEALRQAVRQKLQDNPAYQLLRERFLAAFSFPAALAALPPPRVVTTLSGGRWWEGSQGEDSSSALEEEEEEEGEEEEEEEGQEGEEEEAEREPQGATRDGPAETMEASEELEVILLVGILKREILVLFFYVDLWYLTTNTQFKSHGGPVVRVQYCRLLLLTACSCLQFGRSNLHWAQG